MDGLDLLLIVYLSFTDILLMTVLWTVKINIKLTLNYLREI